MAASLLRAVMILSAHLIAETGGFVVGRWRGGVKSGISARTDCSARLRSPVTVQRAPTVVALSSIEPRWQSLARELVAGAMTPLVLGAVILATIAGSTEPEGTVLRFVPRVLQEIIRDSRIAWTQYSNFEYVAAQLAVAAMAPDEAWQLLEQQRAGPDIADVACTPSPRSELRQGDRGAGNRLVERGACCDIYLPQSGAASSSKEPMAFDEMLVFVPGGAWSHGFKRFYTLTSRRLADELGCPVAVVGYDLYPIADGAAQVAQVDAAIRWAEAGARLSRNRDRPGPLLADGAKLMVVGHSAGGHLAATALLRREEGGQQVPKAEREEGHATSNGAMPSNGATLTALALLSAPFELRRHVAHEATRGVATISALSAAFVSDDGHTFVDGDEAKLLDAAEDGQGRSSGSLRLFEESQPLAQLSPEHLVRTNSQAAMRLPPTVALFHGEADPVVPVTSTRRFKDALRQADYEVPVSRRPHLISEFRDCSHLDYILELITKEDPPLIQFLRQVRQC